MARDTGVGRVDQLLDFTAAGVLLLMLLWAIAGSAKHFSCSPDPVSRWESLGLVSVCAAGFVAGRLLSHLLEAEQRKSPGEKYVDTWMNARLARIAVQAGLAVFLVTATGLLVYEAFGLDSANNAWPITFYVRCATHINGPWGLPAGLIVSGLGAGFFCFLIGHWIWYPGKDRPG